MNFPLTVTNSVSLQNDFRSFRHNGKPGIRLLFQSDLFFRHGLNRSGVALQVVQMVTLTDFMSVDRVNILFGCSGVLCAVVIWTVYRRGL